MKKTFSLLLVVFMMVGLVTIVGCNGLWNFDDDDASVPTVAPIISLKSAVSMPTTDPNASLRASIGDYSVLTAKLFKRGTTAPVLASVTVDASGTYELKVQTSVSADYFVKVSNSSNTVTLYNYITVNPTVIAPSLDATNATSTALGILIRKADTDGKAAIIGQIATTSADFIKIAGDVKGAWGNAGGVDAISPVVKVTGITLNKKTTSIVLGGTETLTIAAAPTYATDLTVKWSSSNTSVATVDGTGKITANATATGTTNITATTNDGSGLKETCAVTVIKAIVPVTGISLNKTTLPLNLNASETLTATVAPANASDLTYAWASSNTAVATVDTTGKVVAKAAGTANITVTTTDGKKVDTCIVTVTAPTPKTNVTFDKSVAGLAHNEIKVVITNAGTDFSTTTKLPTASGDKEIAKAGSLSTSTKLVLITNDIAPVAITSFNSLTFTTAIPAGAKVEVLKAADSSVLATSNNL